METVKTAFVRFFRGHAELSLNQALGHPYSQPRVDDPLGTAHFHRDNLKSVRFGQIIQAECQTRVV